MRICPQRIRTSAVVVLAVVLSMLTGCGGYAPSGSQAFAHPSDAVITSSDALTPARRVVKQYLSAVVDGRSGDAAMLLSPEALARGVGRNWLQDRPPISNIEIGDEQLDGAASGDNPRYIQVKQVPVSFYLDDFSMDQGFEGGDTGWGYLVGETSDHTWLIIDNGMG